MKRLSKTATKTSAALARSLRRSECADIAPPEAPKKHLKVLQPSMSKTELLLACPWPWGKEVEVEQVGLPARFGSAFHEVLAEAVSRRAAAIAAQKRVKFVVEPPKLHVDGRAIQQKWGDDVEPQLVVERVRAAWPVLNKWMAGENPWQANFWRANPVVEKSIAYAPACHETRFIPSPSSDTHEYQCEPDELPGTGDIFTDPVGSAGPLILDHKTGYEVDEPERSGQLRSLALGWAHIKDADRAVLAILHAPEFGAPVIYPGAIRQATLNQHRQTLLDGMMRMGSGFLRPGPHCEYCPARMQCPTQTSAIAELRGTAGPLGFSAGRAYPRVKQIEDLLKHVRDLMRQQVEEHGPQPIEGGREVLALVERPWTNLSQASIKRALGEAKAARELKRLEKLGCIEHTTRTELRAEPDRG